jgi:hypothetical protein
MNYPLLMMAATPLIALCYFAISLRINKQSEEQRESHTSVLVLTGMLTALAILIPLSAGLVPEKQMTWAVWWLVGSLFAGVFCVFGTIYCMMNGACQRP